MLFSFTLKHSIGEFMNSILEITENEYLIKLNRSKFNLSFIRSLLKMVEIGNPTEENLMMIDKHVTQNLSSEPEYYSPLDEK